ncbi:MAG: hypothetical protein E7632_01645 [Ruminococcaceae bacterium]|nr:hypothetical protein [Oscillospiraceae bacterium]
MKKKQLLGGAAILAALLLWKGASSNRLTIRCHTLRSAKITSPIRIAQIADLHESRYGDGQAELLRALRRMKPDLIVITGDIIEDDDSDPREETVITLDNPARPLFEALPMIAPCYMVLGNHECNIPRTDLLCREIEGFGIQVLHRAQSDEPDMTEELSIKGNRVYICGADDPYFDKPDLPHKNSLIERMAEDRDRYGKGIVGWRNRLSCEYADIASDERLTILLSHRPEEFALYRKLGFDAAFSGHAHGGQWRLPPFINGVYAPHQGFFPDHAGGVYEYDGFTHIVSRGLSKKRMVRIFNRPELWQVDFLPDC